MQNSEFHHFRALHTPSGRQDPTTERTAEGPEGHPPARPARTARTQAPQCLEDNASLWDLLADTIAVVFVVSQSDVGNSAAEPPRRVTCRNQSTYLSTATSSKQGEEPKMSPAGTNQT